MPTQVSQPIEIIVNKLRSSGLQLIDSGDYLMQSFGVSKTRTLNYCTITELKGSDSMQALMSPPVTDGGPFNTINYQSKSIITSGGDLEFTSTQQYSSIFCDSREVENPTNCDSDLIL